ncbi:MAG: hypothetical protein ACTHLW_20680, partial [Verrucomicrobiota bacterium]
ETTQVGSVDRSPLPQQYVRAEKLLEILFTDDARPSLRWLRDQQAKRAIPFTRVGRLCFFDPVAVKAEWDSRNRRKQVA